MRAYMFINALHGQSLTLTQTIRGVAGVTAADAITGDYDVVAAIEAKDLADLRDVLAGVQAVAGVIKTTTCMVLAD
ncbi:MAG: Lrp/AsnC ligand binding domain [Chloroflexota bacterium]|nr:Lrp/AsnC ligand binding domain [Chloroflexota bacterium]